jgi:hypothetical protein
MWVVYVGSQTLRILNFFFDYEYLLEFEAKIDLLGNTMNRFT